MAKAEDNKQWSTAQQEQRTCDNISAPRGEQDFLHSPRMPSENHPVQPSRLLQGGGLGQQGFSNVWACFQLLLLLAQPALQHTCCDNSLLITGADEVLELQTPDAL